MPASCVSVLGASSALMSVLKLNLTVLSWGNVNLIVPTVVLTTIVSPTSRVPVCAAHAFFFKRNARNFLSFHPVVGTEFSELSLKDLFWIRVTPPHLLKALLHNDGIGCSVAPIMHTHAHVSWKSAHATCFLFAARSPRAWFKFGWLGNTCGLDVQFVKTIHPLFLTYTSVLQAFAKHTVIVMWCRKGFCSHDVAFCCGQNNV